MILILVDLLMMQYYVLLHGAIFNCYISQIFSTNVSTSYLGSVLSMARKELKVLSGWLLTPNK